MDSFIRSVFVLQTRQHIVFSPKIREGWLMGLYFSLREEGSVFRALLGGLFRGLHALKFHTLK